MLTTIGSRPRPRHEGASIAAPAPRRQSAVLTAGPEWQHALSGLRAASLADREVPIAVGLDSDHPRYLVEEERP